MSEPIAPVARRPLPTSAMVLAVAATTVGVALLAVATTGALRPETEPGLPDPGTAVRVAIPLVQGLRDVAAALTVGMLVVVATCIPGQGTTRGDSDDRLVGTRARGAAIAQVAAVVWAACSLALTSLVYADASGAAPGSPGFWTASWSFTLGFELGQALLAASALALLVAAGCALARSVTGLGLVAVLAVIALWPIAQTGHAAGTLAHDDAVTVQMGHLVGIAIWFGGLVSLVVLSRALGPALAVTARRWSTLAGWALALVALSGVLAATLRLRRLEDLISAYGGLLALKTAALVLVALAGLWQRRRLLGHLESGTRAAFLRLATLEGLILSAAAGLGIALSRTSPPPPPGADRMLTAAESMLGRALPPPIDAGRWVLEWDVNPLWLALGLAAIGWYLHAVVRLRRRGDRWPVLRTASWCLGWALFIWATNGAPGAYGRVLFSMHMVQHMTVATAVPVFLVLGTPITLALRTTRRRADGSSGPREWLLRVVQSLPVQLLGHPIVAGGSFVVSMAAFYYGPAFETTLSSHTAHVVMIVHFLISGYLFAEVVVGEDPGVHRPIYPLRALLVMVVFGFHALFAVSLMAQRRVLAEPWFEALGRTWGATPAEDQYLGASIGWLLGEYPLAVMAVTLLISWVLADRRERRRFDREEDRNGDRALTAYNDALRRMSDRASSDAARSQGSTLGTRAMSSSASTADAEREGSDP